MYTWGHMYTCCSYLECIVGGCVLAQLVSQGCQQAILADNWLQNVGFTHSYTEFMFFFSIKKFQPPILNIEHCTADSTVNIEHAGATGHPLLTAQ